MSTYALSYQLDAMLMSLCGWCSHAVSISGKIERRREFSVCTTRCRKHIKQIHVLVRWQPINNNPPNRFKGFRGEHSCDDASNANALVDLGEIVDGLGRMNPFTL